MLPFEQFEPSHGHLLAIDSDGCAFDSMNRKHREAFLPAWTEVFQLPVSAEAAREVWDFVNLFGATRGVNRFQALVLAFDHLREHPATAAPERLPSAAPLTDWIRLTDSLSEKSLLAAIESGDNHPLLRSALEWTREVDRRVAALPPPEPFPGVRETLAACGGRADRVVVSQAPSATLHREWTHAGLAEETETIAGQEYGSKAAQVRRARKHASAAHAASVLLIGDAPADQQAAAGAGVRFFPILPGGESASWQRLRDEALPRFFSDRYDDAYECGLCHEFNRALPATPPWTSA